MPGFGGKFHVAETRGVHKTVVMAGYLLLNDSMFVRSGQWEELWWDNEYDTQGQACSNLQSLGRAHLMMEIFSASI